MGRAGMRCAPLLCAVLMLALTGAGPPSQPAPADAVTVDAEGLAPLPAGKPLPDVRREALLDARRNAVVQAHVLVETQDSVEGMRLREALVRARAFGYVERMDVREEGPVEGSDPPLYRVRVRATVRSAAGPAGPAQVRGDPYRPVVALTLSGGAGGLDLDAVRGTLLESLQRCGVAVQEAGNGPALELKMSLAAGAKPGGGSFVADWELSAGPGDAITPTPAGLYVGRWEVETGGAAREPWRRVGTLIAQDAVRLWATPRPTTVRFLQPSRAQANALTGSFGRSAEARVKSTEDLSELSVVLPVAGNPLTAVGAFVQRAGLSDQVEMTDASLTELTYRCRPAPERP